MEKLNSTIEWLIRPLVAHQEAEHRRVHLLAWLHLIIFMLLIFTLVLMVILKLSPDISRRYTYVGIILGLIVLFSVAYVLNGNGYYKISAGMTVACAIIGPWVSALLDPTILDGDFVPLTYVALSVLLSSILLSPSITIILAAIQWIGLLLIPLLNPVKGSVNWFSFLAFIFFTATLSILASIISQRDLEQIDRQTRQLAESEEKLREQSIRDHLTNLFNRRYMEETLVREVTRAERSKYPLGIIMLDIDHFKPFNDTLGHAAGDILLQELGKMLSEKIRQADIVCRYGGDEFVLILPDASLAVTKERAELLHEKVGRHHMKYENQIQENITISLGVAIYPDHGSTGEAVLKSADTALYQAKEQGRDSVVVADIS